MRSYSSSFHVSSAAIVFGVFKKGGFSVDIRPGRMQKIHIWAALHLGGGPQTHLDLFC